MEQDILEEIYDLIPVGNKFTAIELINQIDCLSEYTENTQHSKILSAIQVGRNEGTIRKEGKKFVLISWTI